MDFPSVRFVSLSSSYLPVRAFSKDSRQGVALPRRTGAALELGADDGEIAGVVARGFLLLVGGLVLLIHDDEAEVLQRGEDGAAGADDDVGAAFMDLIPFVMALAVGEVAVEHGDALAALGEAGLEALDGLRGEADFGDEDERGLALLEDPGDGLEIDLRLAAAGDTVEEHGLARPRDFQCVTRTWSRAVVLFVGQGERGAGDEFLVVERIAFHADFGALDDALLDQHVDDLRGAREFLAQFAERGGALPGREASR